MTAARQQPQPRLLVVDDEAFIRAFAERTLSFAGYGVALAADGSEALRIAREQGPFDLFVIDFAMPDMSGEELANRLRQDHAGVDIKVLYFTGYSDRLFTGKTRLRDNEAFVDKPVTVKGLLEAVSLMLFGHTHGLGPKNPPTS